MIKNTTRFIVPRHIAVQNIQDEILLLPEMDRSPEIWLLSGTAAAAFDRFLQGWSIQEAADQAAQATGAKIQLVISQLVEFAEQLKADRMLIPDSGQSQSDTGTNPIDWQSEWSLPEVGAREPVTVMAGTCTMSASTCRGRGQRPVRTALM